MRIIAGSLGGRAIKTVESPGCRPAMGKVRNALFSMLEARGVVWNGLRVLDLFAGSGSVGFEALSRGAGLVTFVESDRKVADCISENIQRFGLDATTARISQRTVEHFLKKRTEAPYDVIFVDPPYGKNLVHSALRAVLKGGWIETDGMLVAEVETGLRMPELAPMSLLMDRSYGQTRILLWTHPANTSLSTPEPLTP